MDKLHRLEGFKELPQESKDRLESMICGTHNGICMEKYSGKEEEYDRKMRLKEKGTLKSGMTTAMKYGSELTEETSDGLTESTRSLSDTEREDLVKLLVERHRLKPGIYDVSSDMQEHIRVTCGFKILSDVLAIINKEMDIELDMKSSEGLMSGPRSIMSGPHIADEFRPMKGIPSLTPAIFQNSDLFANRYGGKGAIGKINPYASLGEADLLTSGDKLSAPYGDKSVVIDSEDLLTPEEYSKAIGILNGSQPLLVPVGKALKLAVKQYEDNNRSNISIAGKRSVSNCAIQAFAADKMTAEMKDKFGDQLKVAYLPEGKTYEDYDYQLGGDGFITTPSICGFRFRQSRVPNSSMGACMITNGKHTVNINCLSIQAIVNRIEEVYSNRESLDREEWFEIFNTVLVNSEMSEGRISQLYSLVVSVNLSEITELFKSILKQEPFILVATYEGHLRFKKSTSNRRLSFDFDVSTMTITSLCDESYDFANQWNKLIFSEDVPIVKEVLQGIDTRQTIVEDFIDKEGKKPIKITSCPKCNSKLLSTGMCPECGKNFK